VSPAARKKNELMPVAKVEAEAASRILTIRGQRVVLDSDLAEFYGVETKALNRQVRSNRARFPEDFVFQLTREEFSRVLRCRNRTSNDPRGGTRYRPLVFTELGALAVSGVLKSERAAEVSVAVARAFVAMRGQLAELASHPVLVDVAARIAKLEKHSTQQTEFNRLMRDAMRDFDSFIELVEAQLPEAPQARLQAPALRLVAAGAEDLKVLDRRGAAHGEGDDVVVLDVEVAPALDAAPAVPLEHGELHLLGYGLALTLCRRGRGRHDGMGVLQLALALALASEEERLHVVGAVVGVRPVEGVAIPPVGPFPERRQPARALALILSHAAKMASRISNGGAPEATNQWRRRRRRPPRSEKTRAFASWRSCWRTDALGCHALPTRTSGVRPRRRSAHTPSSVPASAHISHHRAGEMMSRLRRTVPGCVAAAVRATMTSTSSTEAVLPRRVRSRCFCAVQIRLLARRARRGQREPGERAFKEAGERIAAKLADKRLSKGLGQPYGPKAAALGLGQATPPSRRTRGTPPGEE
jgi:hypothetical protein